MSRRSGPAGAQTTAAAARWSAELGEHVIALAWSPDGDRLAAASIGGPIAVFAAGAGERVYELAGHEFGTMALAWSPDGQMLASSGQDGRIRLWSTASGEALMALEGGAPWVARVAWSPAGDCLASAAGKIVRFWEPTGLMVGERRAHASTVSDIAWHPTRSDRSQAVLAAAAYGALTLWNPIRPEPVDLYPWKGSSLALAWSPDATYLATGDQDSTVHFWITRTGDDLQMWGYARKVRELSWDRGSRFLATGGGHDVVVWDCAGKGPEGTTPLMLRGHKAFVSALAYQPNGDLLASGGDDGLVALWRPTRQARPLQRLERAAGIAALAWSPDGRALAVGTESGEVMLMPVVA
ncbi:MAG TPA: WD40 repeat domain-containing protein [Anaerolineales bacterium]|nr:WD40 repeat domain-containing protein [Anaerolineales bacterium]